MREVRKRAGSSHSRICSWQVRKTFFTRTLFFALLIYFLLNILALQCCYFLLYSKVNQLYIYIYPLFYGFPLHLDHHCTFLVAHTLKNPLAIQETWVQSLGWEDPFKEGMATHSSIHAQRIPTDRGAWWATVHGVKKKSDTTERQSIAQHSRSTHWVDFHVVYNRFSLVVCFIHSTVCMLIPISQFILPHLPPPEILTFVYTSVSLFLLCK